MFKSINILFKNTNLTKKFIFAYITTIIILSNLVIVINIQDSYGHTLFNSDSKTIGNYHVQIGTEPEIPTTGDNAKILMRISTINGEEVTDIPITIRIIKDGTEIDRAQRIISNGHYEFYFKFPLPGNYIFYIDVNDIFYSGKIISFSFNVSTLNPFGYFFFTLISFAVCAPFVIFGILYRSKIKSQLNKILKRADQVDLRK